MDFFQNQYGSRVLELLEEYKKEDLPWKEGKSFSYIYDAGEEVEKIGRLGASRFLFDNGLDPTAFPSYLKMEQDILSALAQIFHAPSTWAGNFTSGGTESILLAVKTARDFCRDQRNVLVPELVLPVTAHAAFHKACHYLQVKPVLTPIDPKTFRALPEEMEKAITPNTIMLVASAPSYAHGVVDPIPEIARIAQKHNILLHVDSCIGGMLLPYFKRLGKDIPSFDFELEGVTSLSVDLHKYGFSPKGASFLIHRDRNLRQYQFFACSNWTGYSVVNATVQSSKSLAPLAGAWSVFFYLGDQGYLKIAQSLLEGTEKFLLRIQKEFPELEILGKPDMTLVALASQKVNLFHIVDEMAERGWHIQPQLAIHGLPTNIHFSFHPGNLPHLDQLLTDLRDSMEAAKKLPPSLVPSEVRSMVSNFDFSTMNLEEFFGVLQMLEIQIPPLPKRMAEIHEFLELLPPKVRDKVLLLMCNQI
ncbi:MAG: aspartate aminotransferase family protein, partial [Planctomycetota bacterium]